MKFLLGLVLGATLTAVGAYWLLNRLGMDALQQCRLTSLNANLAIHSGIVDGKEREVLQFIRNVAQMDMDELERDADDAIFPQTKKRVAAMLERRLEMEESLLALPSQVKQTP